MSADVGEQPESDGETAALVARQLGRPPRDPWRVQARCAYGRPAVIASPPMLAGGSRFPTLYWLTCPWLIETVGALESAGAADAWAERVSSEVDLAAAVLEADVALRDARASESGGVDECGDVGLAGQQDPLGVKCVHAHVALALAGIADPIGDETLAQIGYPCEDDRCARLQGEGT